jgi:hypothetical protein
VPRHLTKLYACNLWIRQELHLTRLYACNLWIKTGVQLKTAGDRTFWHNVLCLLPFKVCNVSARCKFLVEIAGFGLWLFSSFRVEDAGIKFCCVPSGHTLAQGSVRARSVDGLLRLLMRLLLWLLMRLWMKWLMRL